RKLGPGARRALAGAVRRAARPRPADPRGRPRGPGARCRTPGRCARCAGAFGRAIRYPRTMMENPMSVLFGYGFIPILLILLAVASLRILREYERGVIFQLGRFWKV